MRRLVEQLHQLLRAGSPFLNDGANLATDQSLSRQVLHERYYGTFASLAAASRASLSWPASACPMPTDASTLALFRPRE